MHTVRKLKTVGFAFIDIVLLIFGLNYKWGKGIDEKSDISDICYQHSGNPWITGVISVAA